MSYSKLITRKNLLLALRRIQTGVNVNYKNSFRHILESYNLSAKRNLENLRSRLNIGAFEPTPPIRAYYPKPNGFQRPLTYLSIEDQIVYQALANIFQQTLNEGQSCRA